MTTPAIKGGTPVRNSYLVFGSPRIEEDEIREVVDTIRSGWVGTGPRVARFEEQFRSYVGARHAVAVSSCTAALHLSMIASGVGEGDEVITSPMTFGATANAVVHTGAKPVFADCDPQNMNISPDEIEKKITPKTRAIIPVHFAGRPCGMQAITELARDNGLLVIEDAAHAIETLYRGRHAGTMGDMGCFSFYVTKNISTVEGGMVVTDSDEMAAKIKIYALHGMTNDAWKRFSDEGYRHYQIVFPGFKYNMTDIQAAFGLHQLTRIEQYARLRQRIWQRYNEAFRDLPLVLPSPPEPDTQHACHLYTVLLDLEKTSISRDRLLQALHCENIGCGVHYLALHLHPYYARRFGYAPEDFPNALHISQRTVSLPLSAKLTDQDVEDVIAAVRKVLNHYRA